jgi:hypothetical protein
MRRYTSLLLLLVIITLGSGCSIMAPQYSASIENVQKIKDAGISAVRVGSIESSKDPANANPISLRGSSLTSPYENSYAAYLQEALKQELSLAGKLKPDSSLEVTGTLLKNDLDSTGISVGQGEIAARFVVRNGTQVRYEQLKSVRHEWESSFVGAIAIPRAQQEFPRMMQKLLAALFGDEAFVQALK